MISELGNSHFTRSIIPRSLYAEFRYEGFYCSLDLNMSNVFNATEYLWWEPTTSRKRWTNQTGRVRWRLVKWFFNYNVWVNKLSDACALCAVMKWANCKFWFRVWPSLRRFPWSQYEIGAVTVESRRVCLWQAALTTCTFRDSKHSHFPEGSYINYVTQFSIGLDPLP